MALPDLHPIVAQMQPSPEQQPAITTRGSDVTVTAGAGTGKTRTLVARYLSLVAPDGGETPSLRSVVAITFTRKAAREMRNRVRLEVQRYLQSQARVCSGHGPIEARDRAPSLLGHDLYTALDAARIGTIHSLCGEILRAHPAEASIDPGFELLSEGQMGLLRAQVVNEALGWIADSGTLAPLFTLLGELGVSRLVATLLDRRLELAEVWARLPDAAPVPDAAASLLAHWQALVDAHRNRALDRFLHTPDFSESLATLHACDPLDPEDRAAHQRARVLASLGTPFGADAAAPPAMEALRVLDTIDLRGGRQVAWRGGKDELAAVKDALRALRDLWRAHADDLTLALNELDVTLAHHIPLIRAVFDWAVQRYTALKGERRALDFDDLEAGAVALLEAHPTVTAAWQREIRALLVDEAQDTNARQSRLLELLNGGEGKLFMVGDAKQSIYRFRGADVTVFRRQLNKSRLAASDPRAIELATSYRAHRPLLELLNALLAPVLGSADDPARVCSGQRPYVEPFAPLRPSREAPPAGMPAPFVELHLAAGSKQGGALDRAAAALVHRLIAVVAEAPALGYGDVAILCRASSSFAAYEDALAAADVPFITVAGRGFYERPEVRDVLNALQAIADPTDDLALAGLLRSPAMGLSDMALYRLVAARQTVEGTSLWDVLSGDVSFLEDETAAAHRARELVAALHALAGRVPVADVLKDFLDATDYRAALRRARQRRAVYNLDKLLADAHASEIVMMGEFLEYVQQLRDVGTREGEAHVLSEGAVQLMTVHAAKGLEFPIVVIGDVSRQSPGTRGPLIDPDAGLVLPLRERLDPDNEEVVSPAVYRLVQAREQDQEAAENDRLLYVAATRARDMLLVSGVIGTRLTGWLPRLGLALELTTPSDFTGGEASASSEAYAVTLDLAGHPVGLWVYPEELDLAPPDPHSLPRSAAPPAAGWTAPAEMPMLRRFEPETAAADDAAEEAMRDPPRRVWRVVPPARHTRAPAWVVGKLVHGALERWIFPDQGSHLISGDDYWTWAIAEASGCGITDDREARDAARRAAGMLNRFRDTSLYAEMAAAPRLHRELPYSLEWDDGRLESGVIDALFESGGAWTLVEFKTDHLRDEVALQALLADRKLDYLRQVRRYLDAVERLLGSRPRGILCFLNCGGAVVLERL